MQAMEPTAHQQSIENSLVDDLYAGKKRIILKGAAGVGKTHLVSHLIKRVEKDYNINKGYNNGLIFVTAPTNKALAVLQNKIPGSARIEFKTVHSALKMKRFIDSKSGMVKFTRERSSKVNLFNHCKMAFVDESSMLNTELLKHLDELKFPIIYVGDQNQINPVGELETPVFNRNYPVHELTEIIRQGAGNPIIDLSRDLDMIFFKRPQMIEGKGYTYNSSKGIIIEDLAEVNGTDEIKYLSWTNVDVDDMNDLVRRRIYGNPKKVELGEILVFDAPFGGQYYTNQEVKVESIDIVTEYVPIPTYATVFDADNIPVNHTQNVKMRYYRINDSFNIVHEDSALLFKEISTEIKSCCSKLDWNWKGFYYFSEKFAAFKYNHAISIHKSQGSTYKQAVLNIGNIYFNKNAYERQRLLYTGCTRASDLVILYNVH